MKLPQRRAGAAIVAALLALVTACGGSGGNNGTQPPSTGGGDTTTTNPCSTALTADVSGEPLVGIVASGQAPVVDKRTIVDGDPRGRALGALWLHEEAERSREIRTRDQRGGAASPAATSPAPIAEDIGDIAILQDQGDIVAPANTFDLRNTGLRFTPSGASYTIAKIDSNFRAALGRQLTLGDDDSSGVTVPFSFPFYGSPQTSAFVNSDGNITFGEEDKASTERNISRVLTGPARVAPFLADLDPTAGGKVFVNAAADQYTVTWCGVRGFDSTRTTTVQATLLPGGTIEMKFSDTTTLTDAVVALAPGRAGQFTAADLSVPNPTVGNGAIGERFAASSELDTIAASRKFFQTHPDNYDQILLWTDQPLIRDAFAFEENVANEVRGIGQDVFSLSNQFGSGGRLRSLVVMDWIGKYPTDPQQKFLGENNTLSVLGQEVGHRWLAFVNFRDHTGASSDELLGRDLAHWSFFFNSEASVMEGNEISDLGGGQFRTTDAVKRYSHLDQYAMGLIPPSAVPTMFYVESPVSPHGRGDAPKINESFTGTRRDFLIDDVIAINGARSPTSADAPKTMRQAFIFIVSAGRSAAASDVSKLDTIRRQWETFFRQATANGMTAVTQLQ